jgi:hypothetical protein
LKSSLRSFAFTALLTSLLTACSSSPPPPPQVFAPLSYNYLPPILLTVSNITLQNDYVPDPAAATLNGENPSPLADTIMAMAQHRLVANGTPGTATFSIETASIEPVGDNYVGNVSVRLDVVSADGRKTGYTVASVNVTQTAPDSDASQNDVQAELYSITKQLMDRLNVQLQYQIQSNMGSWVTYATNAAVPSLNSAAPGGIQAAPLPAPGAPASATTTPTTTTVAPSATGAATTTTVVPLPATPGEPPMGVLGQMPSTPVLMPPAAQQTP